MLVSPSDSAVKATIQVSAPVVSASGLLIRVGDYGIGNQSDAKRKLLRLAISRIIGSYIRFTADPNVRGYLAASNSDFNRSLDVVRLGSRKKAEVRGFVGPRANFW
jgi:hypothetical protein